MPRTLVGTKRFATELQFLLKAEIDFEVGVIGFETHEVDRLIEELNKEEPGHPADDILPDVLEQGAPITREGDLWLLGEHRLLCADATSEGAFQRLMAGEKAQMVFTDPPYNVPINGHVGGRGRTRHHEFIMAAGEMTSGEFADFLGTHFSTSPGTPSTAQSTSSAWTGGTCQRC